MKKFTTDRRLWLTVDEKRVVEEGDPGARFLLCAGPGRTIQPEVAARVGIDVVDGRIVYPGSPAFKKLDDGDTGAKEVDETGARPKVIKIGEAAQGDADDSDRNDGAPEWPGRTSAEAYIKRYPTGPKAELARAVIAAKDDGAGGES